MFGHPLRFSPHISEKTLQMHPGCSERGSLFHLDQEMIEQREKKTCGLGYIGDYTAQLSGQFASNLQSLVRITDCALTVYSFWL